MSNGYICIFTLDRIEDLRRFLISFKKYNNLPIACFLARDIIEAHSFKTQLGFLTPFDNSVFLDIDMLVNGDLSELFLTSEIGEIGVVRELGVKCLNSGMIVFPKVLMQSLCSKWHPAYIKSISRSPSSHPGTLEQSLFNVLVLNFPFRELPSKFNTIIKDISPAEESKMFETIRVFHFLHEPGIDRNLYKSYRTFQEL